MADELSPEELDKLAQQHGELSPEELDAMSKGSPRPTPTGMQAFGRGAVKGATLGLSTPAAGAGAAGADFMTLHAPTVMKLLGYETRYPEELPSTGEAFKEAAGHRAIEDEETRKAHPGAFLGGQLVGGIAPSLVGAGAGGLARNVAQGAGMGAISGAAEASPTGDLEDIAKGAGIGGTVGGLAGTTPSILGAASQGLTKVGQRAGFRALGLTLANAKAFAKQGGEKLDNILGLLGEEPGSIGIKAFGNPASNVGRLGDVVKQSGKDVGTAVGKADEGWVPMSKGLISDMLSKQIKTAEGTPGVSQPYISALKQEAESALRGDADEMGPEAIHKAMMEISPRAQGIYNNVLGPGEKAAAAAAADTRRVLAGILHKQATAAGVGGELEGANALHGALRSIYDQAMPRAIGEEFGNRTLGYTGSHLAGPILGAAIGGGASSGDPGERAMHALEGAAIGLGARRSMQIGANTTSLASPVLSRVMAALAQAPVVGAGATSTGRVLSNSMAGGDKKERILKQALASPGDFINGGQ